VTATASPSFFLDSNIVIYAFDARDVAKRSRAIEILYRVARNRTAVVSPQVLGETYIALTHRSRIAMPPDDAETAIRTVARSLSVVGTTTDLVWDAVRISSRYQTYFWDAMLCATAKFHGVPTLLSEDFQDGQLIDGVRVVNPLLDSFDFDSLD